MKNVRVAYLDLQKREKMVVMVDDCFLHFSLIYESCMTECCLMQTAFYYP